MESMEINKCVICFNNIDDDVHIHVPVNDASNIIGKCSVHLHSAINNDVFVENLLAYQIEVQFCKQCFEHTAQLIELSDQLGTLQKKLLDLSITVSLDILSRRNQLEHAKEENGPLGSPTSLNKIYGEEYANESEENNCDFVITDTRSINAENDIQKIQIMPDLDVLLDEASNTDEFDHPIKEEENCPQNQTEKDVDYIIFDIKKPKLIPRIMIQRNSMIDKGLRTQSNQSKESNGIVREHFKEKNANNAGCDAQDNLKSSEDRSSSSSESKITITTTQDVAARLGLQSAMNKNDALIEINVFKCEVCHRVFVRKDELETHKQVHATDCKRRHRCSVCTKSYLSEWQLRVHERIHTGTKPYKCPICSKSFNQQTTLNNHKRIHTGEKPYKCSHCDRAFTQPSGLRAHQTVHTGEKPYKCSICDKTFNQQTMLKNHKRLHIGERPYKCTHCDWAFTKPNGLRDHQTVHTGEKPYKCHYCEKTFRCTSSRSKHQRKYHVLNSLHLKNQILKRKHKVYPPLKSKMPLKTTATHLQAQEISQTGNQPVCEKTTDNTIVDPKKPNKSSVEKAPFNCALCNRGFLQKRYLIVHERIHSGEKPFKCFYCEKRFSCTSRRSKHQIMSHNKRRIIMSKTETPGLERHSKLPFKHSSSINTASHLQVQKSNQTRIKHFKTLTHTSRLKTVTPGDKTFKCIYCGKAFKYKKYLTVHNRMHTGEKPFKCEECYLTFASASSVKIHSRVHTGEKPFKCMFCGKEFAFASNRYRHQKVVHGKQS